MITEPIDYDEDDVRQWLGPYEVDKGLPYVSLVRNLTQQNGMLSGEVPGSAKKPYRAWAKVANLSSGRKYVLSQCSCPVRMGCKHVAALMLAALAEGEKPERVRPGVISWVEDLRRAAHAVAKKKVKSSAPRLQLFYVLNWQGDNRQFGITLFKGKALDRAEEWWAIERALVNPPQFLSDEDFSILRLLWADRNAESYLRAFPLVAARGAEVLARLAKSGRLYAQNDHELPLQLGEERLASVGWQVDARGFQRPVLKVDPPAGLVIPVEPPWYADITEGEIGSLQVSGNPAIIKRLFSLPPLTTKEAGLVAEALSELAPDLPKPLEDASASLRKVDAPLVAILELSTLPTHGNRAWRSYSASYAGGFFDVVRPLFCYGEVAVRPSEKQEFITLPEGETVRLVRRKADEEAHLEALARTGLLPIPPHALETFGTPPGNLYGLDHEGAWPGFMTDGIAALRRAGWQIEMPDDFRHYVLQVDAWEADLVDSGNGWFDLDMGILVDGQRLPLAPLLAALFKRDPRWLSSMDLTHIGDHETVDLITDDRQRIRVEAGRIKPLAATLIDLFDGYGGEGNLRMSRFDAPRLAELNDTSRWQFNGQADVMALAEKLRDAQGVGNIPPPQGLGLALRHYQEEGLAWLQFLREHQLSGILADDMGLGKTAQTLAHLLIEKESGRLDRPALIVLPTSLIFNWKAEAARFAPGLSVLSLHGPERKQRFAEIPQHDVVLTTYPLLWRDAEELKQHAYHLLILDEAQTVKNSQSRGAETVRLMDARHRLCLTGTPLENHLGELWSQFDFLLPGFLGSSKQFTRYWRTPIEKLGDGERRGLLARRIRPFILRRKKEDVAKELPPKTVIVRTVELESGQRDLYETVRAAMDAKVREEIAAKGLARSQIVILDALLKLRQVCCDPRLLKTPAAKKVREHAKLDLLMAMLPELVDEGRRILVFSQFTSMLALVEEELVQADIPFVLLTGDTVDREKPIRRFQAGEVPVFLISLKAGGVGLNLTAADTVIHYDPWWNPAVENQATDRAHRLGQDKPVFVYKLVVSGSIEEKILTLQQKKAELAAGILAEDRGVDVKFGSDDLAALFAPLPE